jgi:hypothetical protein
MNFTRGCKHLSLISSNEQIRFSWYNILFFSAFVNQDERLYINDPATRTTAVVTKLPPYHGVNRIHQTSDLFTAMFISALNWWLCSFSSGASLWHQISRQTCTNSELISKSNRPWRPIGLWDVKDPTLSRQSACN